MGIINMGIRRSGKKGPGGTSCYFTAGSGGEKLVPGKKTGALIIGSWTFDELFHIAGLDDRDRSAFREKPLFIHYGGWQSWSAGWELGKGETLPAKVRLIPDLIKCTSREGDRPGRGWITGHFIMYLRAGDWYLCIASREGNHCPPAGNGEISGPAQGHLPPVSYRVNRNLGIVVAEVFCPGRIWRSGEPIAELRIFFAQGYFHFKDTLAEIYGRQEHFKRLAFLSSAAPEAADNPDAGAPWFRGKDHLPGGYESWYNHYTQISEALIRSDLEGLEKNGNLIKLRYLDRKKPVIFQIDDGWERAVGDWEIHRERFPRGLKPLAEEIENRGYIPGLWIAPFLVTRPCRIFREKPEWILRDAEGPVSAGFNHLWSGKYYCLDLSRPEVEEYLSSIIDRAIDEWGFRYLKLDFLYAGFLLGNFAGGGSPYEHYHRLCSRLTARTKTTAGEPVAYLGCGVPLGPSYRYFPLSRIGADTREEWDWTAVKLLGHVGRPGAYPNLKDTIGRSFMDGAVYINDPDVIFLRNKNCTLKPHEKELIALVNFLLAGQIMCSDDPAELDEETLSLTKGISALYDKLSGDEYGAVQIEKDVYRLESRSGNITG
ncbi:MAG: alpha-galactosidase, partial [Treponema sp.]|nr:alpha-galactosidase [Treponema sp.]